MRGLGGEGSRERGLGERGLGGGGLRGSVSPSTLEFV